MKQVSLRQFSLQPTKYLKELPIILTRYNLPVATIIPNKKASYLSEHIDREAQRNLESKRPHDTFLIPDPTKPLEQSKYPTHFLGKPLSGNMQSCTVCGEGVPVEFAQQHYVDEHGDI